MHPTIPTHTYDTQSIEIVQLNNTSTATQTVRTHACLFFCYVELAKNTVFSYPVVLPQNLFPSPPPTNNKTKQEYMLRGILQGCYNQQDAIDRASSHDALITELYPTAKGRFAQGTGNSNALFLQNVNAKGLRALHNTHIHTNANSLFTH